MQPDGHQDSEESQPPTPPPRSAKKAAASQQREVGTDPDTDDSDPPTPPPRSTKPTLQRGAVLDDSTGLSLPTDANKRDSTATAESAVGPEGELLDAPASSGERRPSGESDSLKTPAVELELDENLVSECDAATRELEQEVVKFENEFAFAQNAQIWSDTKSNASRTDSDLKLVNSTAMATLGERCVLVGNLLRGDTERPEDDDAPAALSVTNQVKLLKCRFRALVVLCRAFQAQHRALDASLASTAPGADGPSATGWRIAREAVVVAAKANEALDHAVALVADSQSGKAGHQDSSWQKAEESQFLRDAVVSKRLEAQTCVWLFCRCCRKNNHCCLLRLVSCFVFFCHDTAGTSISVIATSMTTRGTDKSLLWPRVLSFYAICWGRPPTFAWYVL